MTQSSRMVSVPFLPMGATVGRARYSCGTVMMIWVSAAVLRIFL